MKVDYIIVGLGLAGLAFVEELLTAKKSFIVFEDSSQTSSLVAGGVYNPVILKRFTPVWNAKEQLAIALPFYKKLEEKLAIHIDDKFTTKKVFKSIEDQNNWFIASDKPKQKPYLDTNLDTNSYNGVIADFNFGNVKETGKIDTRKLLNAYRTYLKSKEVIRFEKFDYKNIEFYNKEIKYEGITSKRVVFSEGFGLKQNPFFDQLPLNGTKGETVTIHAPELNIEFLLKSTLFVLPIGNNNYKIGATFNREDKTPLPTAKAREEIITKLENIINVPYKILDQSAGIRPTVKDRRPLVGVHKQYQQLAVLNGLGTRGVMIGPTVAKDLFNHLEFGTPLDPEIDITRFEK
ncbi:FAD-binding oxidoreductase [Polaribacter sp.]|nr:FAD-binding oxidoreductase [Polaribacter sp.]